VRRGAHLKKRRVVFSRSEANSVRSCFSMESVERAWALPSPSDSSYSSTNSTRRQHVVGLPNSMPKQHVRCQGGRGGLWCTWPRDCGRKWPTLRAATLPGSPSELMAYPWHWSWLLVGLEWLVSRSGVRGGSGRVVSRRCVAV